MQNQNLLFWKQEAFLNDNVQRKKRKGCPWSSAVQKRSQILFWQPWNPSPFFTGLWRAAPTVCPYVNRAALLWRGVNKRNTYSTREIHIPGLQIFQLPWKMATFLGCKGKWFLRRVWILVFSVRHWLMFIFYTGFVSTRYNERALRS